MDVLIAGAGIGGLTAALCCIHHGHHVRVFEKAPALGEVGAGIQVSPNAMKVLGALGLAEALTAVAFCPEAIEARMGESGRHIFSIPLADYAEQKWGASYLHVHRADYMSVLSTALRERAPKALHLGAAASGYAHDDQGVSVTLSDGRAVQGDCLIGADGIHSKIREQMVGPDAPIFTGNVAWRAVVPIEALGAVAPNPTACVWMGRGRHGVTYRLRRGERVNFVGVVECDDPNTVSGDDGQHTATESRESWVTRNAAAPDTLYRWALYDRPPLSQWTDGCVALLGDAAHPMLPFLAQGAAMAVEDAWVLATQLSRTGRATSDSLRAYQSLRFKRTRKVQARSRANMRIFHQRSRLAQVRTYGPMWLAGQVMPKIVHSRMHWLYGYDVTQM